MLQVIGCMTAKPAALLGLRGGKLRPGAPADLLVFDPDRPWQYHIDTSITPQSHYLIDLKGRRIVDFVGRYESLQSDFDTCCDRIGIPRQSLPHQRRAEDRSAYRDYYDAHTRELVATHFASDIEAFGYSY